jgi:hypothetical protein
MKKNKKRKNKKSYFTVLCYIIDYFYKNIKKKFNIFIIHTNFK